MRRLRGIAAVCTLLATGITGASCSSDTGNTQGAGGTAGTGGTSGSGGADASVAGATADSGTGGADGSADAKSDADTGPHMDWTKCGNGLPDPLEECDDGNKIPRDGCENSCRFTCTDTNDALCQDGNFCNGRETCSGDHKCVPSSGNLDDGTICGQTSVCTAGVCARALPNCGDTLVIDPEEECDPPDPLAGCGTDCRFLCRGSDPARDCVPDDPCAAIGSCNEGTHQCQQTAPAAKDLDPCTYGTGTNKACVSGVCTDKYCSNKIVDPGEDCDDGNRTNGDGCDNDCHWSCVTNADCASPNSCIQGGTCGSNHKCSPDTPKAAGTACGTKQNCLQGNCIAPVCGDGFVAQGVEACDDGNAVNGDGCDSDCTKSCVNPATDCPNTPPCRIAVCTNDKCDSAPDGTKDGNTCNTGGGQAKCSQGACTNGTCGNGGAPETGEQCDDANLTPGDGCEANCTFTCTKDADCNDGDPCNGAETCNTGTHKCENPADLANGISCGTGKICVSASCRPALCGDGIVTGSEGCEPPNTVGCDSKCQPRAICDLTGNWAMKVSVPVSFGDGSALEISSGVIEQWAKLKIVQTGTDFTATLYPCGLTIPDFQTTPTLGSEWYGIAFPTSAWDAVHMPNFPVTGHVGSQLIGATFDTFSTAILLGVKITAPADPISTPWPTDPTNLTPFTLSDEDDDAKTGVTAQVKTGPVPSDPTSNFKNIIVAVPTDLDLTKATRADNMYLGIRQIASQSGIVDSCDAVSGTTSARIENHIVGCSVYGENRACTQDEWTLPDAVRPAYVVDPAGGTFSAKRLTGTTSTCAVVRSAIP